MARGTQHRKRRPRPNARSAAVAAPAKPHRRKPPEWQEQLFFQRLRVHAKWLYLTLALAFALTFALLGVGSGSTGISDALSNFFSSKGSSGPSIGSLVHKTSQHPNDAADWRALATAYEQKQQTSNAIRALEHYTALRPKDQSSLQELASQYNSLASTYNDQAQAAEVAAQEADPGALFRPPSTTPLGRAFADTSMLGDPLSSALSNQATTDASTAVQHVTSLERKAEAAYKKLAKLAPDDPSTQVQLGQAAESANDNAAAIAAYRRFLKLAPHDPLAPQVRAQLKQLAG